MTFEAWQILKAVEEAQSLKEYRTPTQIALHLCHTQARTKTKLDLEALIGGKLQIGREVSVLMCHSLPIYSNTDGNLVLCCEAMRVCIG